LPQHCDLTQTIDLIGIEQENVIARKPRSTSTFSGFRPDTKRSNYDALSTL